MIRWLLNQFRAPPPPPSPWSDCPQILALEDAIRDARAKHRPVNALLEKKAELIRKALERGR